MPSEGAGTHHPPDGLDARAVALRTRQTTRGGPAAVAVEQYGDVEFRVRNDS